MGCDIHMYIEYKSKKEKDNYWNSFGGRINPGRNYWMFGLMCKGVRSEFEESYPAKGMPEDAGYVSESDNRIFICEDEGEGYCTLEEAKRYEECGSKIINDSEGKPQWVEHPDWHSHSWLSLKEYKKVIKTYNIKAKEEKYVQSEPEYEAILAAMKKLSEFNNDVRVVFWFDN
jgi:hypothetical protein